MEGGGGRGGCGSWRVVVVIVVVVEGPGGGGEEEERAWRVGVCVGWDGLDVVRWSLHRRERGVDVAESGLRCFAVGFEVGGLVNLKV